MLVAVVLVASAARAGASPNLPLDDPAYLRLRQLRALGYLKLYTGGIEPLTEARVRDLMSSVGIFYDDGIARDQPSLPRELRGFWFRPFQRAITRFDAFSDDAVPYSTPLRPELMIGNVSVSCEYNEGRPCGTGVGLVSELDSSVGYGRWVSAFTRVMLPVGSANYMTGPLLERGYANVELGPVALEGGRDMLVLGPGVRAQMMVGENAAPLDMIRISTSHPIKIPRIPVAISLLGAVAWLRDPQTYHDTNLTILRAQLDLFDQFELGATHLLQIEGDGAPHLSFGEAIAEHFTRKGLVSNGGYQDGLDYSNRRVSFDTAYTLKYFRGIRFYYELAFEDLRKEVLDAWLYDGDHLAGIDIPSLTKSGRHGLTIEYQHIGVRSQTHGTYTSGLTNAGFTLGTPLGPDSWSIFVSPRIDLLRARLWPWLEFVRRSDDKYTFVDYGPILRTAFGNEESRIRLGIRAEMIVRADLRVDARALYEHVDTFAFMPGVQRDNGGVEVMLTWTPRM
ncbi:MAG TPA: capsule assembly Wzi family protein [Polyangia bacterium]|nr:capsule assembly Wzi family protein [Polyangia bacterium]